MSAEEADKTATTDASAGDEEEEWLYGGKNIYLSTQVQLLQAVTDTYERICCSVVVHDC